MGLWNLWWRFESSGGNRTERRATIRLYHALSVAAAVGAVSVPDALASQDPIAYVRPAESPDSADVRGRVRDAQAGFERFRRNNLDWAWGGWGDSSGPPVRKGSP